MKISVVIASWNSANTIGSSIQSILMQTYKNFEIIVIDGGSKDGTQDIVKSYGSDIAKFVSERDNGSSDASNKGYKMATGEILTFLSSDDTFASPLVFEKVARAFERPEGIDYVGGAIQLIEPDSLIKSHVFHSRPDKMILGCKAFLPGSFFRRSVLKNPPFVDEIDYANDYDVLCDVLVGKGCKYFVYSDIFVNFLMGGRSNWSRNRVIGKIDMFKVRRAYFGLPTAVLFALMEMPVALLQRVGFRPYTWGRKLRYRIGQKFSRSMS